MDNKPDYTGMNSAAAAILRLVPNVKNIKARRIGANIKTFSGSRNVFVKKFKMRANGRNIVCKLYYPKAGKDTQSCMIYFHGGGFMFGGINNPDGALRDYADAVRSIVISVEYSLAPEYPYPNAVNECFDIASQLFDGAEDLGIDRGQITLAGDSAGGNLALVTAFRLIEKQYKPENLILFYPFCELIGEDAIKKYPSLEKYGKGYFLEYDGLVEMTGYYVPEHIDIRDPMVSPLFGNLELLPPTLIFSAGFDPLKDMDMALYESLTEKGVKAKIIEYKDIIHGFFTIFRDYAKMAIEEIIDFVRR